MILGFIDFINEHFDEPIKIIDWDYANVIFHKMKKFEVIDFETGKRWMMMRTSGKYHADSEPLTLEDYNIMKSCFPKEESFETVTFRSVYINHNGNKFGCALMGFPHAGNEDTQFGIKCKWRSGGFGEGINWDYIRGNGAIGHFGLHFKGSIKHTDKEIDKSAQDAIKRMELI